MARACVVIGSVLSVLGVALAVWSVIAIARDDNFSKAALAAARNPGHAMYEAEYAKVRIIRAFQGVGVITGILLGINGATLVGLGIVAGHVQRHIESTPPGLS